MTDLVEEHYILAGMQMYVNDSCLKHLWFGWDILKFYMTTAAK